MNIDECPICFINLDKQFTVRTPCNHVFCMKCFTIIPNRICPICRYNFDTKVSHKKYIDNFIENIQKNNIINELDFPPL